MKEMKEIWQRMSTSDRIFMPLIGVLGVIRLLDGVLSGALVDLVVGLGFLLYLVGRIWFYQTGNPRPAGGPLLLQAAGIGLWLAALIWRFAM